jgi:UDP-galactopyranose mutase
MELNNFHYIVVGSGFFGCVVAERIANVLDERVIVIEKRNHIGGNSHSEIDEETGIECHTYGSHIFHTSDEKVWKYINRFCTFNAYRHKVLTNYGNKVYQVPINLATISAFYGKQLTPLEAEKLLNAEIAKEGIHNPKNFEEKAISLIGRPLYDAFIKGYTIKQWGMDPGRLSADIVSRIPLRYNYNADYFDDPWQGVPRDGYHATFKAMLNHPNIEVSLNTDYADIRHLIPDRSCTIYTGSVDRFFNYRYGKLGWRTLAFEKEVHPVNDFQGTAVMNFAELSVPYTRVHEFKHYNGEREVTTDKTVIYREYSKGVSADDEPYYPIRTAEDEVLFKKYQEESKKLKNVYFGGRLGTYSYLNMDEAIAQAVNTFEEKIAGK